MVESDTGGLVQLWDRIRGSRLSDGVDPDLAVLLSRVDFQDEVDDAHLARARARVSSRLRTNRSNGGLMRRLAFAGIGGGGLWASLSAAAMAHQVAA